MGTVPNLISTMANSPAVASSYLAFSQELAGFESLGGGNGEAFNSRGRNTSIDSTRWSVAGRVTHRLFRTTQVFGQVRYDQQESRTGTLGRRSDFENILVLIGVRHTFEPIKLW